MQFSKLFTLFTTLAFCNVARASFNLKKHNNVLVYWGQGANQERLSTYCKKGDIDIVSIAFVVNLTSTSLGYNFGNACASGMACPLIEEDIKFCQNLGIKVLLSIGGDRRFGDFGLKNDADGTAAANLLYKTFHADGKASLKPFGTAQIDGFDLDVENQNQNGQVMLFRTLRKIWTPAKGSSLILSAAPQCGYKDPNVFDVISDEEAAVDFAFMQFYSNPSCAINGDGFDESFETWKNFVKTETKAPNLKFLIGLQADGTNQWHIDLKTLQDKIKGKHNQDWIAGVGMWDAKVAYDTSDDSLGKTYNYVNGVSRLF